MAIISFVELLEILESDPNFRDRYEHGVPARRSLRIWFGDRNVTPLEPETMHLVDGRKLILYRKPNDRIYAIEIRSAEG